MMLRLVSVITLVSLTHAQLGPGNGAWETATPESEGLDSKALDAAEEKVNAQVKERNCFIVVKNGKIVKETYRMERKPESLREMWSATKALCSSLFGVAVQRGWANVDAPINQSEWNTRQCNPEATFRNVLTMTAQSADMSKLEFKYDYAGLDCLDVIEDVIRLKNPDGARSAVDWKDKFWAEPLGMEHTKWGTSLGGDGSPGYLNCGFSAKMSCRDSARAAQLWANNGAWVVNGTEQQLIGEDYALAARTYQFPKAVGNWGAYGFLLWIWGKGADEMPAVAGSGAQCTFFSRVHNAVVVSQGYDDGDESAACTKVWQTTKGVLVSKNGNNTHDAVDEDVVTLAGPPPVSPEVKKLQHSPGKELPAIREYLVNHMERFSREQVIEINQQLVRFGAEPVVVPVSL